MNTKTKTMHYNNEPYEALSRLTLENAAFQCHICNVVHSMLSLLCVHWLVDSFMGVDCCCDRNTWYCRHGPILLLHSKKNFEAEQSYSSNGFGLSTNTPLRTISRHTPCLENSSQQAAARVDALGFNHLVLYVAAKAHSTSLAPCNPSTKCYPFKITV